MWDRIRRACRSLELWIDSGFGFSARLLRMRYGAITRVLIAAAVFLSANNHVTSGATSAMARTASIRQANTIESVTRRATNPVHNKNAITLVPDIETNLRPAPASPSPAREPARGRTYGMQLRKLRTKSEADISPQYMDSWRETSAQTDANPIRELLAPWLVAPPDIVLTFVLHICSMSGTGTRFADGAVLAM